MPYNRRDWQAERNCNFGEELETLGQTLPPQSQYLVVL
jgi:hypothetical protein